MLTLEEEIGEIVKRVEVGLEGWFCETNGLPMYLT